MHVPLLDLKAQYAAIKDEIDAAVAEVFATGQFILGPKVQECEAAVAEYSGCRYGIGVSSGTDALLVCLMAEGIGAGHEVITTPYTFFATAGSIARVGARPVFVDIDPVTCNVDTDLIQRAITGKTAAIVPVHLYGQMAEMGTIEAIAERHGLLVIEDAAQAIGAEYRGRRAGSIGHYGCFSFFPSKNLGGAGDGGMVVTNDGDRSERIALLRAHGSKPKYHHTLVGGNFRLDSLQAAVVTVKLRHLDAWTAARQANAARYERLFRESDMAAPVGPVTLPLVTTERHIFNQYIIRAPNRDGLRISLAEKGVATEVYYPIPLHMQKCFSHLGYRHGDFPQSERAAAETLALPIYPEMNDAQAEHVVAAVRGFYAR